jgi:subtilisin family serine protease
LNLVRVRCLRIPVACVLAGLGLVRWSAPAASSEEAPGGVIDAEVAAATASGGAAPVIAYLGGPAAAGVRARADAVLARVEGPGLELRRRFAGVHALALYVDARGLERLARDPDVARVSLDQRVRVQLNQVRPLVGADQVQLQGWTGGGVSVAVLDTGVDLDHPDLAAAVVGEHCFCDDGMVGPFGCCPDGMDEQSSAGAGQDDHGHGTRVAGVVTSDGISAPLGVAPDASLVSVKVVDSSGSGFVSDLLAGLDWVRLNRPDVRVVNVSLGGGLYPGDCDGADATTLAMADAIGLLEASGVLVVAGAGNDHSDTDMILPACVAQAVSVGAVWDAVLPSQTTFGCTDPAPVPDQVTCWSNGSTTTDVFAPGGRTSSALLNGAVSTSSGTSYATPVVSACAADLFEASPDATPAEVAAALVASPVTVTDSSSGRSYARLDCLAALEELVPPAPVPIAGPGFTALLSLGLAGAGLRGLARRRVTARGARAGSSGSSPRTLPGSGAAPPSGPR